MTERDVYEDILSGVMLIKEDRGRMYATEPRTYAPIRALEGIALYKSIRAFECLSTPKKMDEYRDLINYCTFILERLMDTPLDESTPVKKDEEW